MKIAVIGATGGVGRQVIKQGLAEGHHMTAFARNPAHLGFSHENLTTVQGDGTYPSDLEVAIKGQDVVVVSVGGKIQSTIMRTIITRNVVEVMQEHAPEATIVVVSSVGVGESKYQLPFWLRGFLLYVLRKPLADHTTQEHVVEESGLTYFIVRPGGLTDDPLTKNYIVSKPRTPLGGNQISRADVACFIVYNWDNAAYFNSALSIVAR